MSPPLSSADLPRSLWVDIDCAALAHNLHQVQRLLSPATRLMAVVKADGYGHGAVAAARTFVEAGAQYLGVSTVEEAIALREHNVETPILCFMPPLADQADHALVHGITVTVYAREQVAALVESAKRRGKQARCHLNVDTGMGRLGLAPDRAAALARELTQQDEIDFEGIYTHFATAQKRNAAPPLQQWFRFRELLAQLARGGIAPPLRHCANSGALLRLPECHLDMVRLGTLLYGDWPAPFLQRPDMKLLSAFSLRGRIVAIRDLPAGASVGYGSEWQAARPSRLGVVPVGWADGLSLAPHARTPTPGDVFRRAARDLASARTGRFLLRGEAQAPIVGRIGMQATSVDLTDLPGVQVGDVVTIPCRKTAVPGRVPRVYSAPTEAPGSDNSG
ncbi:MAG: alanine racemase [Armatimonadetes bacterium CG_4_10_14_3_um_filter_66_18]|nr:MAG: alanine racemase [Armatimonadetes bacterium CG_4_10_14_3_um_filter_66_18]